MPSNLDFHQPSYIMLAMTKILILLTLFFFILGCSTTSTSSSGGSTSSSNHDKYTLSQVTSLSARAVDPSWNAGGTKIAFASSYLRSSASNFDIWCINLDGTDLTRLTTSEGNYTCHDPSWSPDGEIIAYQKTNSEGAPKYLTIVDIDTNNNISNERILATAEAGILMSISWGPASSKLAYSKEGDIYTIYITGTGETQLTTDGEGVEQANFDYYPCFNHDGTKIIYSHGQQGSNTPGSESSGSANLYTMNSDGTSQQIFYVDTTYEQNVFQEGWRWASSEADSIGYGILFLGSNPYGSHPAITYISNDGATNEVWFASENAANGDPAWSRDGNKIAIMSNRAVEDYDEIWYATVE